MKKSILSPTAFCLLGLVVATSPSAAQQREDVAMDRAHTGRALAYQQLEASSLEHLTTPDRILRIASGGVAPTEIWRALEHAEKVECLDCIPAVSGLVFDSNAKNREISAWWLRRRIFGVFGPGEVYSQVVETLADPEEPETRRAYAAEALGEFLIRAGVAPVARAAVADPSAMVRRSAVAALQRMNTEGPQGELGTALSDADENVRLAALHAAPRVNGFRDWPLIVELIDDESSTVRVRAIDALGALRARESVVSLVAKLSPANEPVASVRAAAAAALGELGDPMARDAVQLAAVEDENRFVRDAARIAARRL